MIKLLVICGPTATGKTSLALHLSEVFNGEIISADSRQVYRGMDIGTGKDLPVISNYQFPITNLKKQNIGCYKIKGINVWGYDLVKPNEEFSVGQYIAIAENIIENIHDRKKLPIIVGGTGLYIKGIVDGIPTADIPKNMELRKSLENKDTSELYDNLVSLDPAKALSLNKSDSKNPRRLIRAIEVVKYLEKERSLPINRLVGNDYDCLFLGLRAEINILEKRIIKRVNDRISDGLQNEIENLLKAGIKWDMQSMNTLGYKEWRDYFDGKISKEELIQKWIKDERNYAKRQMTWFKKDKRIKWFGVATKDYVSKVEGEIGKWYYK